MASLEELGFEIERRIIVFHKDTSMPDNTQLGYVGNPNSCVNGNTQGETLLYNSPSGTRYLDKSTDPYEEWVKVQDTAGGYWLKTDSSSAGVSGFYETFSGLDKKIRNRYLNYAGVLSNISGLPILASATLKKLMIVTEEECTGTVHFMVNKVSTHTLELSSESIKLEVGLNKALSAGDVVGVYIASDVGMPYPVVRLYFE